MTENTDDTDDTDDTEGPHGARGVGARGVRLGSAPYGAWLRPTKPGPLRGPVLYGRPAPAHPGSHQLRATTWSSTAHLVAQWKPVRHTDPAPPAPSRRPTPTPPPSESTRNAKGPTHPRTAPVRRRTSPNDSTRNSLERHPRTRRSSPHPRASGPWHADPARAPGRIGPSSEGRGPGVRAAARRHRRSVGAPRPAYRGPRRRPSRTCCAAGYGRTTCPPPRTAPSASPSRPAPRPCSPPSTTGPPPAGTASASPTSPTLPMRHPRRRGHGRGTVRTTSGHRCADSQHGPCSRHARHACHGRDVCHGRHTRRNTSRSQSAPPRNGGFAQPCR